MLGIIFKILSIILFLAVNYASLSSSLLFSDRQIQLIGLLAIGSLVAILGASIFFQFNAQHLLGDVDTRFLVDTYNISKRESEIITLLINGKTNREISEVLFIGLPTVKTHLNQIYKKLGVSNRASVVSLVLQRLNS